MFPNIKNKFRFVTVSLLLASFVTVISSASAEDVDFSFEVTDCTLADMPASWLPSLDPSSDSVVDPGFNGTVIALTGFSDGSTDCGDGSMDVTGLVDSSLTIAGGESWITNTDCGAGGCTAISSLTSVSGYYDVPLEAVGGIYNGTLTLTWTPAS